MKKCPYCAEEIQDDARKCKHCLEWLPKNKEPEKEIKPNEPKQHTVSPDIYNKKQRWINFDIYKGTEKSESIETCTSPDATAYPKKTVKIYNSSGQVTTFESMDRREEFEYDIHGINKTSKLFSRNGHLIKDKTECRLVSSLEKEEIKEIDYSLKQVYYNENNEVSVFYIHNYDIGNNEIEALECYDISKDKYSLTNRYSYKYDSKGRIINKYTHQRQMLDFTYEKYKYRTYQYLNRKIICTHYTHYFDVNISYKILKQVSTKVNSDSLIEWEEYKDENNNINLKTEYAYDEKGREKSKITHGYKTPYIFSKIRSSKLDFSLEKITEYN